MSKSIEYISRSENTVRECIRIYNPAYHNQIAPSQGNSTHEDSNQQSLSAHFLIGETSPWNR